MYPSPIVQKARLCINSIIHQNVYRCQAARLTYYDGVASAAVQVNAQRSVFTAEHLLCPYALLIKALSSATSTRPALAAR